MSKYPTFNDFIEEQFMDSTDAEGLVKDNFEDAFDSWLSELDVNDIIEYGEDYGKHLIELFNKP